MPTYEYYCKKCKGTFEFFQSMKDDAVTVCPESACLRAKWGKGEVKRQLGTGAGLIFKGSGFYITDYRSEGYKAAAKSDSAAPASSGGESGGGSKSKSESKPETKSSSTPGKSGGKE